MIAEGDLPQGIRFHLENGAFVQLHLDRYAQQAEPVATHRYAQHDQHGADRRVEQSNEENRENDEEDGGDAMQPFNKHRAANDSVQLENVILVVWVAFDKAFPDFDRIFSDCVETLFHAFFLFHDVEDLFLCDAGSRLPGCHRQEGSLSIRNTLRRTVCPG